MKSGGVYADPSSEHERTTVDMCGRSTRPELLAAAAAAALRWLSLGRLRWSRAAFVGVVVALVMAGYEAFELFVL